MFIVIQPWTAIRARPAPGRSIHSPNQHLHVRASYSRFFHPAVLMQDPFQDNPKSSEQLPDDLASGAGLAPQTAQFIGTQTDHMVGQHGRTGIQWHDDT